MKLKTLLQTMPTWVALSGDDHDTILASAIRLGRNLPDIRFPGWSTKESRQQVINLLQPILLTLPCMKKSAWADMADLAVNERQLLLDRNLITQELAARQDGCAALISGKQEISILLNEEDHLSIMARTAGKNLNKLYNAISAVDKHIEQSIDYAYDPQLGYLTADPARLGSGMRASIILHLPALTLEEEFPKIKKALAEMKIGIQGLWGTDIAPAGNLYEMFTTSDLDDQPRDVIAQLSATASHLALQEDKARKHIISTRIHQFLDRLGRSIGILQNAQLMSYRECLDHLSWLRVATSLGIINWEDEAEQLNKLNQLSTLCSKGHILSHAPASMQQDEALNCLRAETLRQSIGPYSFSAEHIESILL